MSQAGQGREGPCAAGQPGGSPPGQAGPGLARHWHQVGCNQSELPSRVLADDGGPRKVWVHLTLKTCNVRMLRERMHEMRHKYTVHFLRHSPVSSRGEPGHGAASRPALSTRTSSRDDFLHPCCSAWQPPSTRGGRALRERPVPLRAETQLA